MVFRFLVNVGLLAIPMGTTVGILMGIDSHRQATGQAPLFSGGNGNGNGTTSNGTTPILDNGITESQYCQKQVGVSPPSTGTQYTLNPNQWGWTEGDPGSLCMNITAFHNHTYATSTSAPDFSVTWQYPRGPDSAPVHAFPYVQIDNTVMPIEIQSLEHIQIETQWTYGVGNVAAASTDVGELNRNLVNANVAIDMFLDSDKSKSQNNTLAKYEVMVWFAAFGNGTQPIGLAKGVVSTQVLNSTTFNLYSGTNGVNQTVLTWVASETTERFSGDIAPLVTKLSSMTNMSSFPTGSTYLGYLSMGSEAFSSNVNVTLNMPVLSIDIKG